MVKTLAMELAPAGVRGERDRAKRSSCGRSSGVPLGRKGTPEDIADAICLLASSKARFITGQTIHVDGGDERRAVTISTLPALGDQRALSGKRLLIIRAESEMDIPVVEGLVRAGAQVFQTTLGPCGNLEGQTRRAHKSAIAALGQVDAVINILSLPPASPIGTTSFDELHRKVWLEIEQPWRAFRLAIRVLQGGCMITLGSGAKNPFARCAPVLARDFDHAAMRGAGIQQGCGAGSRQRSRDAARHFAR